MKTTAEEKKRDHRGNKKTVSVILCALSSSQLSGFDFAFFTRRKFFSVPSVASFRSRSCLAEKQRYHREHRERNIFHKKMKTTAEEKKRDHRGNKKTVSVILCALSSSQSSGFDFAFFPRRKFFSVPSVASFRSKSYLEEKQRYHRVHRDETRKAGIFFSVFSGCGFFRQKRGFLCALCGFFCCSGGCL